MEATPVQRVFGLGGAGGRIADAVARATAGHLPATVVDCDFASLGSLKACQPFFLGQNSSRFSGGQADHQRQRGDLLRRLAGHVNHGGHHQVLAWRREPPVIQTASPRRLEISREDVIRLPVERIPVGRVRDGAMMYAPDRMLARHFQRTGASAAIQIS